MKFLIVEILSCLVFVVETTEIGKGASPLHVVPRDRLLNHILKLERKVAKLDALVKEQHNDANQKRFAFEVLLSPDKNVLKNEVLKFDHVTLNKGNAYNQNSGIFVVPVSGTYLLWANVLHRGKGYFGINLFKENQVLIKGYTGLELSYGTATINHVAQLKKGDHVWFALDRNASIRGSSYSNYGGILMYV